MRYATLWIQRYEINALCRGDELPQRMQATLTPGDTFPGVTGAEVCVSGYSKSVRAVSSDEKVAVYQRYGIANVGGQHEVDHFIPLELGGSNALTNLWPEPYEPLPGAHEKDQVEDYLHGQVCSGNMTLQQAQNEIRSDWYAVYLRIEKPERSQPRCPSRFPLRSASRCSNRHKRRGCRMPRWWGSMCTTCKGWYRC